EPRGDRLYLVFQAIRTCMLMTIHRFRQASQVRLTAAGRVGLRTRELAPYLEQALEAAHQGIHHGAAERALVALPIVAEPRTLLELDSALIGAELGRNHPQECALAGSVGRNQGRALARFQSEGDTGEQWLVRITERKVRDFEQRHSEAAIPHRLVA